MDLLTHGPEVDDALAVLQAHKAAWASLGLPTRIAVLDEVARDMLMVAEEWVAAGLAAKDLASDSMGEAEEWLFLATILRALRMARQTLHELRRHGHPHMPGPVQCSSSAQVVARVFPRNRWDPVLYRGVTADVWMEHDVTIADLVGPQAENNLSRSRAGAVALVLGAGNASMLPVVDLLHKLFVEQQVVVLKLSPVNQYLGPLMEQGLRALTRHGVLRILSGGVEVGSYLCTHPAVDELHLTGSHHTFEAITFGTSTAGSALRPKRHPVNPRRFTCELGNVSPVIIVPGPWSPADIQEQAEQLVTWFVANAGFGCLTPRVMVQHAGWHGRAPLLAAIGRLLDRMPARRAYYPGAHATYAAFVATHPTAQQFGRGPSDALPWTLIPAIDPAQRDDLCFTHEAFCSIMAETALEAGGVREFLDQAVEFANTTLWGTLNATLLVHPASMRDRQVAAAVERAIAGLRYGAVTVNMAAFAAYYLQVTPWGAFPGHAPDDIQSGTGKTANFMGFARPEKSVVRGPFRKQPDPLRVTSQRVAPVARALAHFEGAPSVATALRLLCR